MWFADFTEPLVPSSDWLFVTAKKTCIKHVNMLLSCSFLCDAISCHMALQVQYQLSEYFLQLVTGNSATGNSNLVIGTVQRNDVLEVSNIQFHVSWHEHEHSMVSMWWAASTEQRPRLTDRHGLVSCCISRVSPSTYLFVSWLALLFFFCQECKTAQLVGYNLKVSQCCHVCNCYIQTVLHIQYSCVCEWQQL